MTKKISFLFICLVAFALGYSINNIAISDTAPKIAVVDVQKIVTNSSQVKQLKTVQEKKILEMQKPFFNKSNDWNALKQNMLGHILNICSRFQLERDDKLRIEAIPVILSDGSLMITYTII